MLVFQEIHTKTQFIHFIISMSNLVSGHMRNRFAIVFAKNTMKALLKETPSFRALSQIHTASIILKWMLGWIPKRLIVCQLRLRLYHWQINWQNHKIVSRRESHLCQKWNFPKSLLWKTQAHKIKTYSAKSQSTLKMSQTMTSKTLNLANWSVEKYLDNATIQKGTLYVTGKRRKAPNICASIITVFWRIK